VKSVRGREPSVKASPLDATDKSASPF
jgi:hypothetical protein